MNPNIEYYRRLHKIAKRIVDDGSADADAVAALKTATMELAERYDDSEQALKNFYNDETEFGSDLRKAAEIVTKADDDGDDDAGDRSDDAGGLTNHPAVQAARLLVASGKFGDHGQALHHLLNTSTGQALLSRLKAAEPAKESPMDSVYAIMKSGSIAATCAAIVAKGSTTITKDEICSAAGKIGAERWPELSEAQGFSRIFTASTDEARLLQKAIEIAPVVADLTPLQVGGADAQALDNPAEAIAQLKQLGQQKWPSASPSTQFEKALVDPANHVLARKAVPIPRATTSFEFPR
jgi:hypothetical protein